MNPGRLLLLLSIVLSVRVLRAGTSQETPQAGAPSGDACIASSTIDRIDATADGLLVTATGDLAPQIVKRVAAVEQGFAGVFNLTVDFPGTQLGRAPAQAAWDAGPFATMRIVRYRDATGCGLRMRLSARAGARWTVARRGTAYFIGIPPRPAAANAAYDERTSRAGAAAVALNSTTIRTEGRTRTDTTVQGGFAQRLGTAMLVGTAGMNPSMTFRAIGLENLPFDPGSFDLAAGDLATRFGDTGKGGASGITQLTFRGGGVNFQWPARITAQTFWGRSEPLTLVRFDGGAVGEAQLARSRLFGAQVGWFDRSDTWGLGAGWLRSHGGGDIPQENFHLSGAYERGNDRSLHVTVEQSTSRKPEGGWLTGYAATFEPRSETDTLSLGGYVRATTRDFRAPPAASYFAALRHSYSLFASYRPNRRLTVGVGLGQTKTFSLLDPRSIGTLHDQKSASVAYSLHRNISVFADGTTTSAVSDTGALIPEDSRSSRFGGGALVGFDRGSVTGRVSHDRVEDRTVRGTRLEFTRFDLEAARYLRDRGELLGGVQYLISRQESANHLVSGDVLYRAPSRRNWAFEGDARHSITFAGGVAVRQWSASAGVLREANDSWLNGSIRAGYQRIDVRDQPSRNAVFLSISTGQRLGWEGFPRPGVLYTSGALPLLLRRADNDFLSRVVVHVYEDRNLNGREDSGEAGVRGIEVTLDGRRAVTDEHGDAVFDVVPGDHAADFVAPLSVPDYLIPDQKPPAIRTSPGQTRTVAMPLVRAGELRGHVEFVGELKDPTLLEGIRLQAESPVVTRSATTVAHGEFDFGRVPVGRYVVTLDKQTLAAGTVAIEPATETVDVAPGEHGDLTFRIRRATARERFGLPDTR